MQPSFLALATLLAAPLLATRQTPSAEAELIEAQRPSYPLTTCVVSGEELGSMGAGHELVVEGRLVRLCCKPCSKEVLANPKAALDKVEQAVVKQQRALYPLDVCAVSGEPLGPDAENVVVGTRLVRTCCGKCAALVRRDPAEALAKVDAGLVAKQRPVYPLTTCLVSSEPMAEPNEFLYGVRLVRTCCTRCEKAFRKEPGKFLAQLEAAWKGTKPAAESGLTEKKGG